jgi:branched-chain amino acid transport system ATP-binding protein
MAVVEPLLRVESVVKRFGGFQALGGVSLEVRAGERFGLIGPNGSGKTTLISCIAGTLRNEGGRIFFRGRDITALPAHQRTRQGIARTFQIPRPFGSMTVVENLRLTLEYAASGRAAPGDGVAEAMAILRLVGLDGKAGITSSRLTQIEMRKLELARAMAAKPALLISDEAMAGLSSSEVDDLLTILFRLNEAGTTVIMIEHIMRAVMRFSERIAVLDAGEKIAEGPPAAVVGDKAVERAYLGE